jgi:hypothetical protein
MSPARTLPASPAVRLSVEPRELLEIESTSEIVPVMLRELKGDLQCCF